MGIITIPVSKFMKFAEVVKVLKSNIIVLNNGNLYGIDASLCFIKQVLCEEDFTSFNLICFHDMLAAFIKNIPIRDILTDMICIDYDSKRIYSSADASVYIELLDDTFGISNMVNNMIYEISNCSNVYEDADLKSDINFMRCMSAKTFNGMQMYIKDNYAMSLFSGLIAVNKDDKVQLKVYDINEFSFISNFIVYKKKKITLLIFIRYMKL